MQGFTDFVRSGARSNTVHHQNIAFGGIDFEGKGCEEEGVEREEIPTIFFTREGTTGSQFHNLMEHVGLYFALIGSNLTDTNNFKVVIMDGHHVVKNGQGEGNLVPLLEALSAHPVMDFRDYAGRHVCFEKAIFPVPGWYVFLWKSAWDSEQCQRPSLRLLNFQNLALQGFDININININNFIIIIIMIMMNSSALSLFYPLCLCL